MAAVTDALTLSPVDALAAWAARVRANREQAERFRESPERPDFYAPVASVFKADPRRTNEPALDLLLGLVEPGETWLDIGAGGGRYALPLALRTSEVIALDPSEGMLAILREGMAEHGIGNVRIIQSRWPMANAPQADVALMAHVGYDIEELGPFLDAMEAAARRLCVVIMLDRAPAAAAEPFWPAVHGEARHPLPALREFLVVQLARGRLCEVRLSSREAPSYPSPELAAAFLRQQLFIDADGAKDRLLKKAVEERFSERDGRFGFAWQPTPLGIVSWQPPNSKE
jgi:SAM-dependent methyltransferase